jgi:hypothetical protein
LANKSGRAAALCLAVRPFDSVIKSEMRTPWLPLIGLAAGLLLVGAGALVHWFG